MTNIFSKIKILDCTRVFSWPFATRYFADYWAEVIKVETLNSYDEARNFPRWYFEILNRWKKSINLNLKDKNDLEKFYELIKDVDIFVENFTPNIKKKLKIDYETLSKINLKLIYWSLNWYGENTDKKAYDAIIQAESWFSSLSWESSPMKNATSIIDAFSWLSLALAISSLLYKREKTGKWEYVNIPMIACSLQLLEQNLTETSISWKNPEPIWNYDSAIFPFWFFKTRDWFISIAIWNDKLWNNFTEIIVIELKWKYLTNSDRLKNKNKLLKIIENEFSKFSTSELSCKLDKIWIPNSRINSMKEVLENKVFMKEKYLKKVKDPNLWEYVVPYEFTKYKTFEIEKIRKSPKIGENNEKFIRRNTNS